MYILPLDSEIFNQRDLNSHQRTINNSFINSIPKKRIFSLILAPILLIGIHEIQNSEKENAGKYFNT